MTESKLDVPYSQCDTCPCYICRAELHAIQYYAHLLKGWILREPEYYSAQHRERPKSVLDHGGTTREILETRAKINVNRTR